MKKLIGNGVLCIPVVLTTIDYTHFYSANHGWFSRSPMEILIGVALCSLSMLTIIAIELSPK